MNFLKSLSFVALLVAAESAQSVEIWTNGVSEAGGWYDVDKYLKYEGYTRYAPGSDVSSFCWAGATANLLTYWQEHYAGNLPAGFPKSDLSKGATASRDLFEVFSQNWSNKGGNTDRGIDWFLTGYDRRAANITDTMLGSSITEKETFPLEALISHGLTAFDNIEKFNFDPNKTYSTGGFLNPTNQPSGYSTRYKLVSGSGTGMENEGVIETSRNNFNSLLRSTLETYGCFGLDIGGHALTCWAADFDDTTGVAKSIWITDTDDCNTGIQKIDLEYTYMIQDPKHPNAGDIQKGLAIENPGDDYNLTEVKLSNYSIYQVDANGNTILDDLGNPVLNEETTMEFRGSSKSAIVAFNIFTMPTLPIPEASSSALILLGLGLLPLNRKRKN